LERRWIVDVVDLSAMLGFSGKFQFTDKNELSSEEYHAWLA
jgi:hypothetical protein